MGFMKRGKATAAPLTFADGASCKREYRTTF